MYSGSRNENLTKLSQLISQKPLKLRTPKFDTMLSTMRRIVYYILIHFCPIFFARWVTQLTSILEFFSECILRTETTCISFIIELPKLSERKKLLRSERSVDCFFLHVQGVKKQRISPLLLSYAKITQEQKVIYFTFRIDIRDEPARPGPAPWTLFDGLFLSNH